MTAYLTLENGTIFEGEYFGAQGEVAGEIVFTTGMTGYLETLTDPSHHGQIVLQTFPLIGNYGIIPADFERDKIGLKAYIVKYPCQDPSNFRSEGDLGTFLKSQNVIGVHGIDTRALTKIIRKKGVMNGKITPHFPTEADKAGIAKYAITDAVAAVSVTKGERLAGEILSAKPLTVALLDYGAKAGIAKALINHGCNVQVFPHNACLEDILAIKPDGIMLSNGPGDPAEDCNEPVIDTLRLLMETDIPMFGICLGHQLLALANGYTTRKMRFGHRGTNQPVKDMSTGRVYITSQNHGYTVVAGKPSFVNVNDGSCEGLEYDNGRVFSVQFHPEGQSGPLDTYFLFGKFVERMAAYATR